jgi:uncharacterized protein GlcG (DUF336 family)
LLYISAALALSGSTLSAEVPLATAEKAAKAAFKACKGTPIAFALIDESAQPRLLVLADGAKSRMGNFAVRKAATALKFGKPSADVRDEAKANAELAAQLKSDPALIGFGGGLPFAGGALAVAGAAKQDTDAACAQAALEIVQKK